MRLNWRGRLAQRRFDGADHELGIVRVEPEMRIAFTAFMRMLLLMRLERAAFAGGSFVSPSVSSSATISALAPSAATGF